MTSHQSFISLIDYAPFTFVTLNVIALMTSQRLSVVGQLGDGLPLCTNFAGTECE